MEEQPQRIVPGAPPPTPLSKSQKKKRSKAKPKTGETGTSPNGSSPVGADTSELPDVHESTVVAVQSETSHTLDDSESKPSPIVELISKRLKATAKKVNRISTYASMDAEKLNDDQKRSLKALPTLETIHKELGDLKKVVEACEHDQIREQASRRAESERAEKRRIDVALADSQSSNQSRMSSVLTLLRLRNLISEGHSNVLALSLDAAEISAVFSAADVLLGDESEEKKALIAGFLSGQGEFRGMSYTRLLEIVDLYLNPRAPTPVPEVAEDEVVDIAESTVNEEEPASVTGVPPVTSASLNFTTASEIDQQADPALADSAEWDRVDGSSLEEAPADVELGESLVDVSLDGHGAIQDSGAASSHTEPTPGNGALDWADDEGGLPSIDGLQAKFGGSGTATPVDKQPDAHGGEFNGVPPRDDDGFQEAGRGGRSRGRGFRGDRGSYRDPRSGFRGERGRGGERAFRARGTRGGDRGGYRGRTSGDWRGDGERGRGRGGRGRGGRDSLNDALPETDAEFPGSHENTPSS